MTIALWIAAVLLALMYLAAGSMKVLSPREKLVTNMGWVENFSGGQVKVIGALEVLGALGVILPLATGIAPIMTGVSALLLAILQVFAIIVHLQRGEAKVIPLNTVLLALALAVAVLFFLN